MPEFWTPSTTPRALTLFAEPQGAPMLIAFCEPRLWEGYFVPRLTAPLLQWYWDQCALADPDGTWAETRPFIITSLFPPALCIPQVGLQSLGYEQQDSNVFIVDRLPWIDANPT